MSSTRWHTFDAKTHKKIDSKKKKIQDSNNNFMKTGETPMSDHIDCKTNKDSTTINVCTPNNRHKNTPRKTQIKTKGI